MEKLSILDYLEYNETRFTKKILFKKEDNTAFVLNFSPGQELRPILTQVRIYS